MSAPNAVDSVFTLSRARLVRFARHRVVAVNQSFRPHPRPVNDVETPASSTTTHTH